MKTPTKETNRAHWQRVRSSVVGIRATGGTGSGWIATDNGVVVTNLHVIGYDEAVVVTNERGEESHAPVIYANTQLDIAFLLPDRILGPRLRSSDSDAVSTGTTVYAIGHPFGLDFSVTRGILSATQRMIRGVPYLQTDAAVNPGNSGGPLVLSNGSAIGVNVFKRAEGENLNFAVPVRSFFDNLRRFTKVRAGSATPRDPGYQCTACGHSYTASDEHCPNCGKSTPYGAGWGTFKFSVDAVRAERIVARVLKDLGHRPRELAYDDGRWKLPHGQGEVWIAIDENGSHVHFHSRLVKLPTDGFESLYRFVLSANDVELGACRMGLSADEVLTIGFSEQTTFLNSAAVQAKLERLLAARETLGGLLQKHWKCSPAPEPPKIW